MRRVPFTGDEKTSLYVALDRHRDVVLWKLRGLDDEQLRRRVTPSGMSLLGLLKHLTFVEDGWFCGTFGRPVFAAPFDPADPDADWRPEPHETAAGLLSAYAETRMRADAVIDELDLEHTGTAWSGETVTLRWVLVHMVEETARHAGHADVLRELLDGTTGDHP
jgi:uncharacterized damage-inducible protein DinB